MNSKEPFETISIGDQGKMLMQRREEEEKLREKINSSLGVSKECINTKSDSATAMKARNEEFRKKILKERS